MINTIINKYYDLRGLRMPDAEEALAFLLSEIGELMEAYLMNRTESSGEYDDVFHAMKVIGKSADILVGQKEGWVRNYDRLKTPSVEDEIGDVLMMLSVFSLALDDNLDPMWHMLAKMDNKGVQFPDWVYMSGLIEGDMPVERINFVDTEDEYPGTQIHRMKVQSRMIDNVFNDGNGMLTLIGAIDVNAVQECLEEVKYVARNTDHNTSGNDFS